MTQNSERGTNSTVDVCSGQRPSNTYLHLQGLLTVVDFRIISLWYLPRNFKMAASMSEIGKQSEQNSKLVFEKSDFSNPKSKHLTYIGNHFFNNSVRLCCFCMSKQKSNLLSAFCLELPPVGRSTCYAFIQILFRKLKKRIVVSIESSPGNYAILVLCCV